MTWQIWVLLFGLPVCDRLGGADGFRKAWRRLGIPALIFGCYPTIEMAVLMGCLIGVFSLDFDAIENKNWGAVWSKGLAIAFCVYPICGIYGLAVSGVWLALILWSNIKFLGFKIDWKYTEMFRLLSIPAAIYLNSL